MTGYGIRKIERNNRRNAAQWKALLDKADGTTLFHDPLFLSYHGDRFNEHHLALYKGEELCGIMPLAILNKDRKLVAQSPYGASYGGIVCSQVLNYANSLTIVKALKEYLTGTGVSEIIITPPPGIYYRRYNAILEFAMLKEGFDVINSDITSVVDLGINDVEAEFASRGRNMMRKAMARGVEIVENGSVDSFWGVMEKTFERHRCKPTHSLDQFRFLCSSFPDKIKIDLAIISGKAVAGIAYFGINSLVNMSFYLCCDNSFKQYQAMSLLISSGILKSKRLGFKYFDFGTSSVNMNPRENIFMFKESFGALGRFRRTYKLTIP